MVVLSPELQHRLRSPLYIGTVALHSRVLQSPLSGVTDLVFRRLVRRYAFDGDLLTLTITEPTCEVRTVYRRLPP